MSNFNVRYFLLAALISVALILAGTLPAAAGETKAPEPPTAAQLKALRERLEREKARLADLQIELQQTMGSGSVKELEGERVKELKSESGKTEEPCGSAASTLPPSHSPTLSPSDSSTLPPSHAPTASASPPPTPDPKAADPLRSHPSLGAADALFRLGRYAEARGVYEALAGQPKAAESDRAWALLQAGHCCRRLGDFDAALAHFQQIANEFPDSAWAKGHVPWALRATLWDKRWARPAPESGD